MSLRGQVKEVQEFDASDPDHIRGWSQRVQLVLPQTVRSSICVIAEAFVESWQRGSFLSAPLPLAALPTRRRAVSRARRPRLIPPLILPRVPRAVPLPRPRRAE